jgi:hypothetical protein
MIMKQSFKSAKAYFIVCRETPGPWFKRFCNRPHGKTRKDGLVFQVLSEIAMEDIDSKGVGWCVVETPVDLNQTRAN